MAMAELADNELRAKRSRDLLLFRLLLSLISLMLIGLGVLAISTDHYYGSTSKYGGHEVVLDGASATAMGIAIVLFGLFPLAAWFKTRRWVITWSVACFAGAGAAVYISIHLRHV